MDKFFDVEESHNDVDVERGIYVSLYVALIQRMREKEKEVAPCPPLFFLKCSGLHPRKDDFVSRTPAQVE